ncbi:MAG TPA: protein kinase, partial [Streptosporangiaceae bacterium]
MGEFQLRARLGAGGMGRVYLGYSPAGRAVAVKVVHSELARDAEFRHRFGREVAAARAVGGMYTAPVVAAGLDDDPPWLATAYVPGPPLADVVNLRGPLAEAAVWRLAAGLADALRAVHGCGLVHRDLKPGNVLLAADGPHVIDFGISRAFEGTALTSAGMVVGTPGYMSPEQAEGQQAGPPSDVFSLGCVLAYAATGNAPFGGGSAASILYRVVTAEPDLGGIPAGLQQVITACLSKDPAKRIGLAQLTAMISALGPPLPGTIGAFWPEPLAGIIAADQAPHPPTEVSAPAVSPGMAPAGRFQQGPAPAATGHAPMVADGYYAAAAGNIGAGAGSPGPGPAPYAQPAQPAAGQSWRPQSPAGPQQYASGPPQSPAGPQQYASGQRPAAWRQPAGGQEPAGWQQTSAGSPPGAMPDGGAPGSPYGTPSWPQPAGPGVAPAPATLQATSWPQQQPSSGGSWPGGGQPGGGSFPSAGTPLAQYAPGRRRPIRAELPSPVLGAARLMYLGAVVTALNVLFGSLVKVRYNDAAAGYTARADTYTTAAAAHPGTIAGKHYSAIAKSAAEA